MKKNVLIALSGTVVAQVINIIATLFLVKIISPSLFGDFVTWMAYLSIISVVLSLRMEIALTNEANNERRKVLITAIFKYTFSISFVASIFSILLYCFNIFSLPTEYILLFVGAFLTVCFQISQNYFALSGDLKKLNKIRVLNVCFFSFFQILLVYFWNDIFALCLGYIVGFCFSLTIGSKEIYSGIFKKMSEVRVIKEISKHKNYLKYSLPADLINAVTASLPLVLVAHKHGSAAAGTLGLAFRFLAAPVALLSKAVLDIYKKEASESYIKTGEFRAVYIKTLIILFSCSILIAFAILFFSKYIIGLFLDNSWSKVSDILIFLLPLFCIRFIASPLSYAVYITNMQKIDLIWQVVLIIITFTTLNYFDEFNNSLIAYSLFLSIIYFAYIILSFKLSLGDASKND